MTYPRISCGFVSAMVSVGLLAWASIAGADAAPSVAPTWMDLRHEGQRMNAEIGKIVSPNGVDEAGYVTIGGVRQWVTVRG